MTAPILVCFAVPEEAAPARRVLPPEVKILVTGMGAANAERAFRAKLAEITPRLVLTCGFAGGLNPEIASCTVIFSEDDQAGLTADLLKLSAQPARIHCASRVATTAAEKQALRHATAADAVEMESETIRQLCREKKIPAATIRVISDAANEDLPLDFNALMTPGQKLSFPKLALKLVTAPGKIPALMNLQKRTQAAAEKLAAVLAELLRTRVGHG